MACNWTHEHYCFCLQQAKAQGYAVSTFQGAENFAATEQLIILRHDLDYAIPRALSMARVEESLGIRASYFVRVHASDYNVFEYNTYLALKEIQSMGHEIGLHFEAIDFSHITGESPEEVFLREKKVLETVLNVRIQSAAAHGEHSTAGSRHNRSFLQSVGQEQVGIKYDAYNAASTKDMKYISDSSGRWLEGCMCNHIGKFPRMQILVHPCWWFKEHLFE